MTMTILPFVLPVFRFLFVLAARLNVGVRMRTLSCLLALVDDGARLDRK